MALGAGQWSAPRTTGLILLCVIAVACGQARPPADGTSPTTSYAGAWGLIAGRGPDGDVSLVRGYRITLLIRNGEVGGTSACNAYGGGVETEGESFHLTGGLTMTAIGCAPEVMDSEAAYISALSASETIQRDRDTLTLTGPDAELRFRLLPPPPMAQLIDTVWHLESLIEGTGPEGTVSSAAPARLVLSSNGTVSGTTGCREFRGEWIRRGDEILFTKAGAEGHCPARLQPQDGRVLGVLGDGFTAAIEGQALFVFSKGDRGLQYRAQRPS